MEKKYRDAKKLISKTSMLVEQNCVLQNVTIHNTSKGWKVYDPLGNGKVREELNNVCIFIH